MPAMSPTTRNQWITDLRSGNFKQGRSYLKTIDSTDTPRYCCLGVLAEQLSLLKQIEGSDLKWGIEDDHGHICTTSFQNPASIGLSEAEQAFLIVLNDTKKLNFNNIADWIAYNL